jgi:pSer/pThr/pTyr-binding forkhead associated (FHA) protein
LADIESALITELAEAVKEYCADENYHLRGPVVVAIEIDQSVGTGRIDVDSSVVKAGASEVVARVILPDDRKITLGKSTLVIGRLAECDIAFDDSNVSRRHAEIKALAGGFAVNDLGSTNGTKVNGVTITFERALRDGDIISVGSHSIRYEAQ